MIDRDRIIVRDLAEQVAEIASLPVQDETKSLWKKLNALEPVRPMVAIGEYHVPWHELDVDGELRLRTEDALCRRIEEKLRRILYSWKHLRVDMVVEPFLDFPMVVHGMGFGIEPLEKESRVDANDRIAGYSYVDQLQTEDGLLRIRMPEVVFDEPATNVLRDRLHDVLNGLLNVRMQGHVPRFSPWDFLSKLRPVENLLLDLADRPEFSHRLISRLTQAYLSLLDQLEAKGLLGHDQSIVHVSVVYTDELPAPGHDPRHPRAKDLWACGSAQIFGAVSPAMHQEFELDYAVKWSARFGLVYYGCCEPLDAKIDLVRKLPNLRKIAMSPWVDVARGAEEIGPDFVFVRCPNAAPYACSAWEPDAVARDLRDTISACSRYGCPLEFNVRNISTTRYQPKRLWDLADMAMKMVKA